MARIEHPIHKLVVASHNEGKVREIRDLLRPFGVVTYSAKELDLPEPEETGTDFVQNAELKARAAAQAANMPALADDSGLVVDGLGGAPGIHSARWAEGADKVRDFDFAMQRVWIGLKGQLAPHTARFVCALSLAQPDGDVHTYEGFVEGQIVWPPRGDNGFGYDPIFLATGDEKTFGELEPQEKHAKSHRADAFNKLITAWFPDG